MDELRVIPIHGIPEIQPKQDLGSIIVEATQTDPIQPMDCLVVTQKVVSKAEGRLIASNDAHHVARSQARRILRDRDGLVIAETHHGFICANAGVDHSNNSLGHVSVLPPDPDRSARRLRESIRAQIGVEFAVVITDTWGRPWREGQVNFAIGVAGLSPIVDYRGEHDIYGRVLSHTQIAIADEVAAAAELVMGKTEQVPAAIIRGLPRSYFGNGSGGDLIRPASDDLFR